LKMVFYKNARILTFSAPLHGYGNFVS